MESHYDSLGLSPDADREEVRRAYRALLKEHHPDLGGSRERFLRIKEAYEAITGEAAPDGETDGGAVVGIDAPTFAVGSRPTPSTRGPTVEGEYLSLTLAGLVGGMDLSGIGDDLNAATERTVAFFELENVGSRVVPWRGRRNTAFVGDDGFMYEASSIIAPHADSLPQWWTPRDVDLEPGLGLNALVVAQTVPDDVSVEKVVYTQHVYGPDDAVEDTERYLFEITPAVRPALDEVPFDY